MGQFVVLVKRHATADAALPPGRRGGYDLCPESLFVRTRRLLARLTLPGALAIGTLGLCAGAAAAGLPPLAVHRTEDSADCPDADALAAAVERQMKRPALDPGAAAPLQGARGLDVQIYRSEAGYTAVIQAGGKTRQLSDRGPTCAGLAAALAVSIAVMLDTEPLPPEPEPPPPPAPAIHAGGPAAIPAGETPAIPAGETPAIPEPALPGPALPDAPSPLEPPPPLPDDPPTMGRRFHVSLAVAPVVSVGLLQGFAGGVMGEADFRFGRFYVGGGALALPGQSFGFAPGQVHLDLAAGFVRGCGAILADGDALRLALCAAPYAGVVRGVGSRLRDQPIRLPGLGRGRGEPAVRPADLGADRVGRAGRAGDPPPKDVVLDPEWRQSGGGVHPRRRRGRLRRRAPADDLVMARRFSLHVP